MRPVTFPFGPLRAGSRLAWRSSSGPAWLALGSLTSLQPVAVEPLLTAGTPRSAATHSSPSSCAPPPVPLLRVTHPTRAADMVKCTDAMQCAVVQATLTI